MPAIAKARRAIQAASRQNSPILNNYVEIVYIYVIYVVYVFYMIYIIYIENINKEFL